MRKTHMVFKIQDISDAYAHGVANELSHRVKNLRETQGKNPTPEYLVINRDEPYAPEIIEVLKKHGHWEGE